MYEAHHIAENTRVPRSDATPAETTTAAPQQIGSAAAAVPAPGTPALSADLVGVSGYRPRMQSVLETAEAAFWWLGNQPGSLTVNGWRFPDLPDRAIPLFQLRVRLASTRISPRTRAVVWGYLVRQARTRGPRQNAWTVACAGLALPELTRIVAALGRGFRGEIDDLEAACLGGFLGELRRVDLDNLGDHKLRWRLLTAAYRAARALRDAHSGHAGPVDTDATPTEVTRATAPGTAQPAAPTVVGPLFSAPEQGVGR